MFSTVIVNSPWYFFLLSFLVAALFSGWLYYRNQKNADAPKGVLQLLFAIRFLCVLIIGFLLLHLFLKRSINETEDPIIIVALDNSSSMTAMKDSTFVKQQFTADLKSLTEKLEKKYRVKSLLFGNATTNGSTATFTEKETDIDDLFREIDNNYSNQNVGVLVLVTDGIYNKGGNPLYTSDKLGFPIYSVPMGDTNETKDVLIQKINHNEVVYAGNLFPVEVVVNARKYAGREVKVNLYQNNNLKGTQVLKINSDNFAALANFTLSADVPGPSRYSATISELEGEVSKLNNVRSFVVEVINNKEKILLIANAPHPDISAIKDALASAPNYEIDFNFNGENPAPIKSYNLVIFHGLNNNNAAALAECKTNNIPHWIVNPAVTSNLPGLKIATSLNKFNDSEPYYNLSFDLFNISDQLKKFSRDLPAVKTQFGNYVLSNSAVGLFNQRLGSVETENPILVFSESDGLKTAVFAADGLWKWRFRDFAEHKNHQLFNELISKTIQYLAVKSDKSFFRLSAPRIISENEPFELSAEVYNKSYEPITAPDVTLELINEDKKKFNYTFSKLEKSYKLSAGKLPAGEYRYEAKTKLNNELIVKQGVLIVKEVVSESVNTVANHQLLYQLSNKSGGKVIDPKQLSQLENDILKSELIKPITYTQTSTSPLIELKLIFFILLLLLCGEWYFRKRYLSI